MSEFIDWLGRDESVKSKKPKLDKNPFDGYEPDEFWAYADYKYMIEFFGSSSGDTRIKNCVR